MMRVLAALALTCVVMTRPLTAQVEHAAGALQNQRLEMTLRTDAFSGSLLLQLRNRTDSAFTIVVPKGRTEFSLGSSIGRLDIWIRDSVRVTLGARDSSVVDVGTRYDIYRDSYGAPRQHFYLMGRGSLRVWYELRGGSMPGPVAVADDFQLQAHGDPKLPPE